MPEIQGNSHAARERAAQEKASQSGEKQKNVQAVIVNEATIKKPSVGARFKRTFFGGEDARGVAQYLIQDVAVPALRDTVIDLVQQGIERLVLGDNASYGGRRRSAPPRSHVSGLAGGVGPSSVRYDRVSARRNVVAEPEELSEGIVPQVVLATRQEAQAVLQGMGDLIEEFDTCTVADLKELINKIPEFTDNRFGWTSMAGCSSIRVKNGYLLRLPHPFEVL